MAKHTQSSESDRKSFWHSRELRWTSFIAQRSPECASSHCQMLLSKQVDPIGQSTRQGLQVLWTLQSMRGSANQLNLERTVNVCQAK